MGVELLILCYLPVEGMKHILHPRLGIALKLYKIFREIYSPNLSTASVPCRHGKII